MFFILIPVCMICFRDFQMCTDLNKIGAYLKNMHHCSAYEMAPSI
jgi:hypothetical protein